MKILKALKLEKYENAEDYAPHEGMVFEDLLTGVFCVTLYTELEDGEDTQYPLEDLLDEYFANCTDEMEEREEDGKQIFIVEIEGGEEAVKAIAGLVGKRIYNYEDGDYIKLGIE